MPSYWGSVDSGYSTLITKINHHSTPPYFWCLRQVSHLSQLHIWGLNPLLKVYTKEFEAKGGSA